MAQSSYAPLNEDYYHLIDRYEIKTGRIVPQIHTAVKPYKRSSIAAYVDTLVQQEFFPSKVDQFNAEYLRNDNWEFSRPETNESRKPILKSFYRKKSDLYYVHEHSFDLHINPVLYLGYGNDSRRDEGLLVNTRGVEIRGMVDKKVGFYSYLTDNQAVLPSYVWDQMGQYPVIPHEGFWKEYKDGKGVDFLDLHIETGIVVGHTKPWFGI